MHIHFIGWVLIPLALLYFFAFPRKLYALLVVSIPFTGTALFDLTNPFVKIDGIRASMFIGLLCLFRYFLAILLTQKIRFIKGTKKIIYLVILFAFISALSLVMPYLISGDMNVLDAYNDAIFYAKPKPLYFQFQYVTQVLYFIFGCILACYFALQNDTTEKMHYTIRLYVKASLFVCIWGVLELVLFYLKIPYPSFLFNHMGMNVEGTAVLNDFPRITSVSLEPSIMSQQLLTALPLIFWPVFENKDGLYTTRHKFWLGLMIIILLMSTSATAVFGIAAFIILLVLNFLLTGRVSKKLFAIMAAAAVMFAIAFPFLIFSFIEKMATYSGIERMRALKEGFRYFTEYPVLGIGWGVFPSWDLIGCIAAGMGLIGLGTFLSIVIGLYSQYRKTVPSTLTKSVGYAFVMLLLISEFSGFIYHSQYFWMILGLTISAPFVRES